MTTRICEDKLALGREAASDSANLIRKAVDEKGQANIVLATGTSQFETLNHLVREPAIAWNRVVMFHLDEYIGLPLTHPASFRKYLNDRFLSALPPIKAAFLINGEADPAVECARLNLAIKDYPIDVALIGIGENGHIAFNDPPANFDTDTPFIRVSLDDACRRQQLGEGWFASIDDVPTEAISMSVRQIMKSKHVICSVPDERKAVAVRDALKNPITPLCPASILQTHRQCVVYLDRASAYLLG